MVEHRAIERFGGGRQPARRPEVAVAGTRVAAGVIVREHDAGAAVHGRVGDDLPQRKPGACFVTRMTRNMKASRVVVDMGDPEVLAARVRIRHAPGKEFTGGREAVELQRVFGTLIPHSRWLWPEPFPRHSNRVSNAPTLIHNGDCRPSWITPGQRLDCREDAPVP